MLWLMDFSYLPGAQMWNDEEDDYLVASTCPLDPMHNSSTRLWKPARFREEVEAEAPLAPYDVFMTPRSCFVMRKAVFNALAQEALTGWQFNPARVRYHNERVSDDFGELWVTGFAGIAPQSSGCRLLWRCRACGQTSYQPGLRLAEAVKANLPAPADFFTIWPLINMPFCSDRAKTVLQRFKCDEIRFRPVETLDDVLDFYGDAPVPPFFSAEARQEVEAYRRAAPVWPEQVEPDRK